jgi:hypothetical protein
MRIVERVSVANAFVRHQLEILPAEGVTLARGEVRERHLVLAAHLGIHAVNLPREAIGRQPTRLGVGVEEGPIDLFRFRGNDSML